MDAESCGDTVHDINMLTVIASESYKDFVTDLQRDIKDMLYDRPLAATSEYFKGKFVKVDGVPTQIDGKVANTIEFYLIANGYIDMDRKVTDKYRTDLAAGNLAAMPADIAPMAEGVHKLVQAVFDESVLDDMFTDGHETKIKDNPLNDNFYKKEFQTLWNLINRQYAYKVDFDSDELIKKSIGHINAKLFVSQLQYTTSIGQQKSELSEHEIERGDGFKTENLAPLSTYVKIIKEVAEYYSLPVLDMWAVSGIQPRVPVIKQKYCPDGLHPNDAGHALMAKRLEGFLRSL
jgi:type III restriction enzyme